jgi:uncharacterized protein YjaZ
VLERQIAAAFRDAAALLEVGEEPVDVVVRDAPALTIPEIGVSGVAPDNHTIFINLDPLHSKFDQAVDTELAQTIAHELHHVARRRAGCRGTTLWAAIVNEGLADHFSVELYRSQPPPIWSLALPGTTLDDVMRRAAAEHESDSYDHGVWFLGRDLTILPRWAGYAIGWRVVSDYLERHPDVPPSRLANLSADAFHDR